MNSTDNVIRAFSDDHVVRLTGLSKSQLRYWDETGFFSPHYAFENRRSPYSRVYSFRDVVGLRTISILRKQHDVSLQHLRKVAEGLSDLKDSVWSSTVLYVMDRQVYFCEPESGKVRGVVNKQFTNLPLKRVISEVSAQASKLKERLPEQIGNVERHRNIAHNAWVIAGTRIPTRTIQRYKDAGYSIDDILREYPILKRADVSAALRHEKKSAKVA